MNLASKVLAVVGFAALLIAATLLGNPLRRSDESIERAQYRIVPRGTTFEEASNRLRTRYPGRIRVDPNRGFMDQRVRTMRYEEPIEKGPRIVGVKSIEVSLGDYRAFPIGTGNVTVLYGFGPDDKLIDIWVWRTIDSL